MSASNPDTVRAIHAAIIMDGNGRWARSRGLPRIAGHHEGAKAVRRTIEAAPSAGIGTLTLYAFSSDNWRRPRPEVQGLMRLFLTYLRGETARCVRNGVRLGVIGRRDRLPRPVLKAIDDSERATADGDVLQLRLAIDYSARDAILRAAAEAGTALSREEFRRRLQAAAYNGHELPEVDLLVRTGGEKRLSDFLLWEAAYAELVFSDTMWPDFDVPDLEAAVAEFRRRERRFGRVLAPVPDGSPV